MAQRIEATCRRLRKILAHPGDDRALWGTITVRVDDRGCAMWDTTQIVSWLVQRAAGVLQTCGAPLCLLTSGMASHNATAHARDFSVATRYIAGIGAIIVRPAPGGPRIINRSLHMMLLATAGAFQGSHVALELRFSGSGVSPDTDEILPFLPKFWAAPTPNTQPGLTALAATLTRLEVCTQ